jgi:hypothetical protein
MTGLRLGPIVLTRCRLGVNLPLRGRRLLSALSWRRLLAYVVRSVPVIRAGRFRQVAIAVVRRLRTRVRRIRTRLLVWLPVHLGLLWPWLRLIRPVLHFLRSPL